jgi:hypothetical protein
MLDRLVDARLIAWKPGVLGISLTFASGHESSYSVGNLKEANQELARLTANNRLQRRGFAA